MAEKTLKIISGDILERSILDPDGKVIRSDLARVAEFQVAWTYTGRSKVVLHFERKEGSGGAIVIDPVRIICLVGEGIVGVRYTDFQNQEIKVRKVGKREKRKLEARGVKWSGE